MSTRKQQNVVKNRAPAPIQISAEQIVREAADRQLESGPQEPIVKVHDHEEYQQHLADRRKQFEDNIRYRRDHIGNWVKYARFEEDNSELERARSIFERALEVENFRNAELWLRYVELEIRNEQLNHARNVLDRAVQLLPRVDFLWYKYVYVEELAGNPAKTRQVFERWMEWQPNDAVWMSYAKFELRQNNKEHAQNVLQRYVQIHSTSKAYIKYAKFAEWELHDINLARSVYEKALQTLEPEEINNNGYVFSNFAKFEERQHETERARLIYQHAIQLFHLDQPTTEAKKGPSDDDDDDDDLTQQEREKRKQLYQQYLTFEKKHGDRQHLEQVLVSERSAKYESRLTNDPYDYDGWFEYIALLQENDRHDQVRDIYERAVAQVPPDKTHKELWKRYIYLWIYYAVFEELDMKNSDKAVQIYELCLNKIIPHSNFSFSKIWILLAQLHIRRKEVVQARKLLGRALGVCGKEKIYQFYINLELSLGEVDRCRNLYNNYVKKMPYNVSAWMAFAKLEQSVGEADRSRAIYELGIPQTVLDKPEQLWKSYIDFEIEESEADKARKLYERLLEKTGHVKVWISYAQFESTSLGGKGMEGARKIFENAYNQLKQQPGGSKEERVLLLDAWRVLEKEQGDTQSVANVEAKLPRRLKRKRMRQDDMGNELGWEEYFDYQFPDDQQDGSAASNFKILEMAAKWKEEQKKKRKAGEDDDDSDSDLDSSDEDE